MNNLTLKKLIEELASITVFINSFPTDKGSATKFTVADSEVEGKDLTTYYVRFLSKGAHPKDVEVELTKVLTALNDKTNYIFDNGKYQLVLATCDSPTVFYEGVAGNGEYMYSLEMKIIILNLGGAASE